MTASKTVQYFGYYLYVVALTLLVAPNFLLNLFLLPSTDEVWIRVVGVLAAAIGFYYHRSGATGNRAFVSLTVPVRLWVFVAFTAFVLLHWVEAALITFGMIDLAGALWTWSALRKEGNVPS
jgi:hypothetical protein